LSDFIGVWSRLNCFDDIIKICYESIVNKKKEIIKEYADNYDKMFEKFIEILKTSKVDSKLNEELRKILNIYDHSQTEIVINTFKQDSNLKTSISTSLEILEVSNQDDLTKVKEFMKIVLDRLV